MGRLNFVSREFDPLHGHRCHHYLRLSSACIGLSHFDLRNVRSGCDHSKRIISLDELTLNTTLGSRYGERLGALLDMNNLGSCLGTIPELSWNHQSVIVHHPMNCEILLRSSSLSHD